MTASDDSGERSGLEDPGERLVETGHAKSRRVSCRTGLAQRPLPTREQRLPGAEVSWTARTQILCVEVKVGRGHLM